jgi:hypothetical protein
MLDWQKVWEDVADERCRRWPDCEKDPAGDGPMPHCDIIERLVNEQVARLVAHQRDDALETVGICPLCGQPDFGEGHACYGRDDDA